MTQIIERLSEISSRYDALFCDLWGCLHNGLTPFPDAVAALQSFKAQGGTVVLVTNSPRPWKGVAAQLAQIGVPEDCWDLIATSGDSARVAMFQGAVGSKVYYIGTDNELGFFEPMQILDNAVPIERVPLQQAEGVVCTALFHGDDHPDSLRPQLMLAKQQGLKLLCANPDIIVDRGERREFCAGAVAALYTELGGESLYFGKPHPPIYDLARRRLSRLRDVAPQAILAVGDGLHTDISGAVGEDIDTLFITGGLAAAETATETQPNPALLNQYLADKGIDPLFSIGFLR